MLIPQKLSLPPGSTDLMKSNLGMYRIQLSGNDYITNQEIGLHYQIHRGIRVLNHQQYIESKTPFKISIFIEVPIPRTVCHIPITGRYERIDFCRIT